MDMQHLLKQAERLRKDFAELEGRLKAYRCEGTAGGGGARVRADGTGEILELEVDDGLAATGDAGLIAETVLAAIRQALDASRAYREQQRASLTGGLPLPDL